ncbi:MAG: DUF1553 domain-containing protein [Turneriella sp.]
MKKNNRAEQRKIRIVLLATLFGLGFLSTNLFAANPLDAVYAQTAGKVERADELRLFRRLSLQLRGVIPRPEETVAFMRDQRKDKLKIYAAEFLRSREFAEYWGSWLGSLFREQTRERNQPYAAFDSYLKNSLNSNKPYAQLVAEMLTASGEQNSNPATSFYLRDMADPVQVAEYVGRVFYGQKVTCARCHNHPYDAAFTQERYFALAAFFSQGYAIQRVDFPEKELGAKIPPQNTWERFNDDDQKLVRAIVQKWRKEKIAKLSPAEKKAFQEAGRLQFVRLEYDARLGLRMPPDGDKPRPFVEPVFLDGSKPNVAGLDRRKVFADWLTADKNTRFRRVFVSRVWHRLTGQQFYYPFDDLRPDTKIRNEPLLAHLEQQFFRDRTRLKEFILYVVTSDAWARKTAESESADDNLFFHPVRFDADQLFNSLLTATQISSVKNINERAMSEAREVKAEYANLTGVATPRVPREKNRDFAAACEVERPAPRNSFLSVFGAGERNDIEDDETDPTLEQVLVMLNGQLTRNLAREATQNNSYFEKLYNESLGNRSVAEAAFLAVLTRPLTDAEWNKIREATEPKFLKGSKKYSKEYAADFLWSLINSQEFIHVH